MANLPGPQPDVLFCPRCKGDLRNVARGEMRSKEYERKDGAVPPHTHTYECRNCKHRFEINQEQ
ncbi:MAG TPA: hypothetical protein VN950_00330 [Terriglobales bacterium]|nr:hypothetical protein [Terriglobales bacterium]